MSNCFVKVLLAIAVILPTSVVSAADKVVVIVNEANKDALSKQKIKDIYSDRVVTWSTGKNIELLNLSVDDPVRETFSREVLGMSAEDAARTEAELSITDSARNPAKETVERLVVSIVGKTPNAIGYVSEEALAGRSGIRRVLELGGKVASAPVAQQMPERVEAPPSLPPVEEEVALPAPPKIDDGIHDPSLDVIDKLADPVKSMAALPHNKQLGVDWGMAIKFAMIKPKPSKDGKAKSNVIDMDIIMSRTGNKPAVKFAHKLHTEWLDCGACHPALFEPLAKGNPITMEKINNGEYCGACHGTVAQPVTTACDGCHIPATK